MRLAQVREAFSLTQREMAAIVGVTPRTYARHEAGCRWRGEPFLPVADRLGVSIDWLVAGRHITAHRRGAVSICGTDTANR